MNTTTQINLSAISSKDYVTYDHVWFDAMLAAFAYEMHGMLFDLCGKRDNKCKTFVPLEYQASTTWQYINLDARTYSNVYADFTCTPAKSGYLDCVVCIKVIERLLYRQFCMDEIRHFLFDRRFPHFFRNSLHRTLYELCV